MNRHRWGGLGGTVGRMALADRAAQASLEGSAPSPLDSYGRPTDAQDCPLSNGAALYRDSDIPWDIEAAAREAVEEHLG